MFTPRIQVDISIQYSHSQAWKLTRIVPKHHRKHNIQAHQDHALEPVGLAILHSVVHDDDGEEHHDRLEGVEEEGEGLADDPA